MSVIYGGCHNTKTHGQYVDGILFILGFIRRVRTRKAKYLNIVAHYTTK